MCLSRDAAATLALSEKLVARGWSRRAAWEKAESWQRMTLWNERARRMRMELDAGRRADEVFDDSSEGPV